MRSALWIVLFLLVLTSIGTLYFWQLEGWTFLDALYMTIITLSTVGYHEVHDLSPRSQVFVIVFLVMGLGVFMFGIAHIGELIVRAELSHWLRRRGMHSAIRSQQDHYIICGFGRMGRTICQHLADRGLPFVAIDRNEEIIEICEEKKWLFVCDDATEDSSLQAAGIGRARGLAAVLNNDADNLYIVLSARLLQPDLQITARALDENSACKLEKAGADRVVSLYTTGGATMAQILINPDVAEFVEFDTNVVGGLDFAEVRIGNDSPYLGMKLCDSDFRQHGVMVVAIRRADGKVLLPPPKATVIQENDELVAMGQVAAVSKFLAHRQAV